MKIRSTSTILLYLNRSQYLLSGVDFRKQIEIVMKLEGKHTSMANDKLLSVSRLCNIYYVM